ncbi:hypothetical protein DKT74_33960 [Streptomyces sp. ZEA17I]|nr:hypothetical protein DKT74_33960 [Streptomyces sp. ZEA17I]
MPCRPGTAGPALTAEPEPLAPTAGPDPPAPAPEAEPPEPPPPAPAASESSTEMPKAVASPISPVG